MHVRMFVWYGAHTDMRLLVQNMQLEWEPPLNFFTNHRRTSIANHILSNVLKLQDKKCISAYLFSIGLDDQDPSQWDDADLSHLDQNGARPS